MTDKLLKKIVDSLDLIVAMVAFLVWCQVASCLNSLFSQ